MCDDLAQRWDVAADHRLLVKPRLEIADPERLVRGRHRVHVTRVERRRLLRGTGTSDLDDALVGVSRELVDHRSVEAGHSDEDEARLVVALPHELGGVEQMDVALVALATSHIEDHRRSGRNAMTRAKRGTIVRAHSVRAHARRDHAIRVDALLSEPRALPVGHRGDDRRALVAEEVRRRVTAVELPGMRERRQHDRQVELIRDAQRAVEVLAADVVDEVAVLRVSLELLAAHEVDQRRRIGDVTEETASWLHLDDIDSAIFEARSVVEGLTAYDAHVVPPRREPRRPLIREALRAAHRRVGAFREQDLHPDALPCKVAAAPRVRMRPRTRPYR